MGKFGILHKHVLGHLYTLSFIGQGQNIALFRDLPFGKRDAASRLVGNNPLDIPRLEQGPPPHRPALRMCDQDSRAYTLKQCGIGVRIDLEVCRAERGCHLPEKLIQCLSVAAELHTLEVFRPNAYAEPVEPHFFVKRRGYGNSLRPASGSTMPPTGVGVSSRAVARHAIDTVHE